MEKESIPVQKAISMREAIPLMEYVYIGVVGGTSYAFLEILWRGYTHWSMIVAGMLAAVFLYWCGVMLVARPLWLRCLVGALGITAVEFAIGCVVNLWWQLGVWDYSALPGNVLGQICPLFTGIWCGLCLPAYWLCGVIRRAWRAAA